MIEPEVRALALHARGELNIPVPRMIAYPALVIGNLLALAAAVAVPLLLLPLIGLVIASIRLGQKIPPTPEGARASIRRKRRQFLRQCARFQVEQRRPSR